MAGLQLAGLDMTDTSINLSNRCGIGLAGSAIVAEVLTCSNALTSLRLYNTGLGDDGARLIARALEANGVLDELYVSGNGISERGGCALARALRHNETLRTLWMEGNDIGVRGRRRTFGLHRVNRGLRCVRRRILR